MENKIKSFTDLQVWREAHKLVLEVYGLTKKFPREEIFGLTSQLRRAAVSISSNIAEGFARKSYKEKTNFYYISQGSLVELQNQLLIARDTDLLGKQEFQKVSTRTIIVHKLLSGIIKSSARIHNSQFTIPNSHS